jgi:hypothetical protein
MVGYAPVPRFVVRRAGNGANPPYELSRMILFRQTGAVVELVENVNLFDF